MKSTRKGLDSQYHSGTTSLIGYRLDWRIFHQVFRLMDIVLKNLVGVECWIFIDDLIVFSRSAEEHALRLKNVLQRLDKANLQLHPGKCVFAKPQVQYLGFVLSENGVSASSNKVKAVRVRDSKERKRR